MSLAILDMSFKDIVAERLRIALDGQVPDTLCKVVISHPDGMTLPLTLEVLGAPHAVSVGKRGNPSFTEKISCIASHGVFLSGIGMMVKTHMENLSPEVFTQRAGASQREFGAGHPHLVVVKFPGSPGALTMLSAKPIEQGYRWGTWHGYPSGQLVWTSNTWTAIAGIHRAGTDRVKGGS